MKLETSPKVTKYKRSLHWCRSISKKISVQVLLQYQSKSYYIIGQEVYYSIGRFITLSGIYYIIGRFLLHYRAVITVSGVYYIIGWYRGHCLAVSGVGTCERLIGICGLVYAVGSLNPRTYGSLIVRIDATSSVADLVDITYDITSWTFGPDKPTHSERLLCSACISRPSLNAPILDILAIAVSHRLGQSAKL